MARRLPRGIVLALTLTSAVAITSVAVGPASAGATTARTTTVATSTTTSTTTSPTVVTSKAPAPATTPYMGISTWSLESTNYPGVNPTGGASFLNEKNVLAQADVLAAKLKPYGYDYVNVDAGWANSTSSGCCSFGNDPYGRPIPNPTTFPDGMKYVGDYLHNKGLKFGLYLAVGLQPSAYDGGKTPIYGAPGCTTADIVYPDLRTTNGWNSAYKINFDNPCSQAYINSVADELAGWGVDFLKLDGVGPGSFTGGANYDNTSDVAAWSSALKQTGRSIQFVISWSLSHTDASVWQEYTNGWRVDTDVECYCNTLVTWQNSVVARWNDVVQWIPDAGPGHWNNLDSLDVGDGQMDGITPDERQSYMTLWAIEASPLYIGDDLTKLDSYGLSLLTNREVIAVDQAGNPAKPVNQRTDQQVWYAKNSDGSYTVALFNLGDSPAPVSANWGDLGISGAASVHDLWSHKDLGSFSGSFSALLPTHGSRLLRITPRTNASPAMPANVHGTAATGSSVSLAWDPATGATGYDVYVNGTKNVSVSGTSATVAGLAAGTQYQFTVVARNAKGKTSAASEQVPVTTTADTGPVTYEAESPSNIVGGGAGIYGCSGCSGGEKVGYLGGGGYLTFPDVTAPADGTYLLTVAYVDGDESRAAVVTVNGNAINLPTPGTGDNNWDQAQTLTIPVQLKAGTNTITFGNPTSYVADIDKIAV